MAGLLLSFSLELGCAAATTDDYAHEPSSKEQLDATVTNPKESQAPPVATMSKEQREWEIVLKQNLGSFYYPRYLAAKKAKKTTAWDYVKDDPKLPRVLIIGDSISRGYTVPVRNALAGKANVHRAPANCGPTSSGLRKLTVWLGKGKWDVITFNFGIHNRRTKNATYKKELLTITNRLQSTGAKLIWMRTTPVPVGASEYVKGASERTNTIADAVMREKNIPAVDLYAKVLPVLEQYQLPKNCHYKLEGYEFLGGVVAKSILNRLEERKEKPPATKGVLTKKVFFASGQSNAKPVWASAIKKELVKQYGDRVIFVHRFHGGDWLHAWYKGGAPQKNYKSDICNMSGTAALQKTLADLTRKGDPWEFCGFFWFQGEGDSGSDKSMDAYAKRFNGMLSQMKKDLQIKNDFIRVLAVIDGNRVKKYDIPKNLAGRTRQAIDKMRGILIKLGTGEKSAHVDTKGYPRTDAWHLKSPGLIRIGSEMGKKAAGLLTTQN